MGVEVVFKSLVREVEKKLDETAKQRMNEAVNLVRNQVLETLSGSRTGRTYKVPGTQRTYTASSPGEPPAQATGRLRQTVRGGVEGKGSKLIGYVGTELLYGLCLEFGTYKMAPRPWLRPSFEQKEAEVKELFTRLWF